MLSGTFKQFHVRVYMHMYVLTKEITKIADAIFNTCRVSSLHTMAIIIFILNANNQTTRLFSPL